jgi:hypothetical protein
MLKGVGDVEKKYPNGKRFWNIFFNCVEDAERK